MNVMGTPIDYAILVVYFAGILGFGAYFARFTKSTQDFFFGGQRFSWWLIAASLVATGIGRQHAHKSNAAIRNVRITAKQMGKQ